MASDPLKKALRYRWFIFAILASGYILVYFHRLCPAVVALNMMRDLHVGGTLIGLLGSAYFYPYAIMQFPAGLLSDSWGARRTVSCFFSIAFVGSLLLGLAPSLFLAIVGRALVGLGVSMLFVPTLKVLAEWFRPKEFAMMTGVLMAMGGVGALIATTPFAFVSNLFGWRLAFILIGVVTILLACVAWLFVRDRPSDLGWPSLAIPGTAPLSLRLLEGVKIVLTTRSFWPLAIWFFFNCSVFYAFGGMWGGPYLIEIYKLDKAQTGQILSMIALGMIVGAPLLSFSSNRVFHGRKPVLILSSSMLVCITAFLTFYTDRFSVTSLYVMCLFLGICAQGIVAIVFITTKELFPVQIAGTASGLVNLFPFIGAGVFQPFLGYLMEREGKVEGAFTPAAYSHAFFVLFLCGMIAFVASLFLRETMARE